MDEASLSNGARYSCLPARRPYPESGTSRRDLLRLHEWAGIGQGRGTRPAFPASPVALGGCLPGPALIAYNRHFRGVE